MDRKAFCQRIRPSNNTTYPNRVYKNDLYVHRLYCVPFVEIKKNYPQHYDFNTDKVCNSLRIQVLVDTCAMRHLCYRRTLDTTLYPSDRMQSYQTSCPALLIANLFRSHELNARLTENAMALPQTVSFKAEAVDEEGIWCPCTVEDVSNDSVIVSFDGWNAEWNRRICDPRENRNQTVPDCKRKRKGHQR